LICSSTFCLIRFSSSEEIIGLRKIAASDSVPALKAFSTASPVPRVVIQMEVYVGHTNHDLWEYDKY